MEDETIAERKERISSMTYTELVVRKDYLMSQLPDSNINTTTTAATSTTTALPTLVIPKVGGKQGQHHHPPHHQQQPRHQQQIKGNDTHWDYVLKELMWLSADFASERKRQVSQAKRLSSAVMNYHNTKHYRIQKELAEIELKRRKIASKISKLVMKQFWIKVERLITYKQHLITENERQQRMDQHLRSLVQRTEIYSQSLQQQQQQQPYPRYPQNIHSFNTTTTAPTNSVEEVLKEHFHHQQQHHPTKGMTYHSSRNHKKLKIDYKQLLLSTTKHKEIEEDNFFYGQPIGGGEEEEDEDSSFHPSSNNSQSNNSDDSNSSFQQALLELHPSQVVEEVQTLLQETNQDLHEILTSSYNNYLCCDDDATGTINSNSSSNANNTQSTFSTPTRRIGGGTATTKLLLSSPTQAEEYISSGSEEFIIDSEEEPDDETTLIEEERLGREMSPEEEIAMLQQENEMSMEQLLSSYFSGNNSKNGLPHKGEEGENEQSSAASASSSGSEEFIMDPTEAVDDETTLIEEERLGREMSPEEEIAMLQQENEIPIEQLLSYYFSGDNPKNGLQQQEEEGENEQSSTASASSSGSDEFLMDPNDAVDDETTLLEEERLGREMSPEEEIAMLQQENEIPIEQLLSSYFSGSNYEDGLQQRTAEGEHEPSSASSSGSDEFVVDPDEEVDDETTLIEEERLGREISPEEEIAMLQQENEIPIEQLLSSYYPQRKIEEGSDAMSNESFATAMEEDNIDIQSRICSKQDKERDLSETALQENMKETNEKGKGKEKLSIIQALQVSETRARENNVTRPFLLSPWVKLRPYQQIGLNWLVSLQSRRLNGILADEMGLGKTLQTISMLAYLAAYHGIWGPHLIIVPTSVILNWETEFKRFCPAFKVLCYYGSAKRRKELRQGWTRTNWHHIVVTSYQLAVQDSFAFKRKRWYYLILDEAHNIKNFQSQRWQTLISFNTQRRLLLTGTPLQNNLMELWSLLHFLMPHIFRDRKEFSYWFSNPMNQMIEGNATRNDELISRLHGIIRPFVLRRLKHDVETQMPGKHEHIVKCQLSRRQMFLYEEFMGRSSTRMAVRKGGNFLGMMNVLMQLRKVCNHPDLFDPRSILTPYFTESLHIRVPALIVNALETSSFQCVSSSLINSLWSKSCGIPCFNSSLEHDCVSAAQLQSLQSPQELIVASVVTARSFDQNLCDKYSAGLRALLTSIWVSEKEEAESNARTIATVNSWRCQCEAFPYNSRTLKAVHVGSIFTEIAEHGKSDLSAVSIAETPTQLLELMRTYQERSEELDGLIERFVFCVPRAGARRPFLESKCNNTSSDNSEKYSLLELDEPLTRYFSPFKKASSRLTSFFPEQKLVQFDAGKLVVLAELLKELKKGGHRVLIFTQMTKMLDILEAFVNLHGLTYLRLDGSVGVDERQRLMDRFNNDPKIFCFILSTRSGGLGINLTGADTVVFYDSDWCPSIDAQAQDRAHRIGQTREVHIYRLITEHTIEENILLRARQKRQLDFLVMDEGKFHAISNGTAKESVSNLEEKDKAQELFTKSGLRDILGVVDEDSLDDSFMDETESSQQEVSMEQVEKTMAALEDEDDAKAKIGAEKEAACELQEFDESIQFSKDAEDDGGLDSQDSQGEETSQVEENVASSTGASKKPKGAVKRKAVDDDGESQEDGSLTDSSGSEEAEQEFKEWQSKVGINLSTISESLSPVERYALKIKEHIDPFYSARYLADRRRMQEQEGTKHDWDIDEIEEAKAEEERRAVEEGDLLVTKPTPKDLIRQRLLYLKEKARRRAAKKRRFLTGENWCLRADAVTNHPFWYNTDTGEALWDKPVVLIELEAEEIARKNLWSALPMKSLIHVMSYLSPYPDRMQCALVCRQWRSASGDFSFVKHVWPVECGALTMEKSKLDRYHYVSIEDAVSAAHPGDTIELGDGHYWVKDLSINFPLRFVGDENDPSHVVIELSGSIRWSGSGGWMEGITMRRPRLANDLSVQKELMSVEEKGWLDMNHCVFNGAGSICDVVTLSGKGNKGRWNDIVIKGAGGGCSGLILQNEANLCISNASIEENGGYGLVLKDSSSILLTCCRVVHNGRNPLCFVGVNNFINECSENNVIDDVNSLPLPSFRLEDIGEKS